MAFTGIALHVEVAVQQEAALARKTGGQFLLRIERDLEQRLEPVDHSGFSTAYISQRA